MKRDRLNALMDLLDKLIKGDACMSFQEFDMSEYTNALEEFIGSHGDELLHSGGDPEEFRRVLTVLKSDRPRKIELAKMAIKQYGSIERYTAAMKNSMEHFPALMKEMDVIKDQADDLMDHSNQLMKQLTSDLSRAVTSPEVQKIVENMVCLTNETNPGVDMGDHYWSFMAEYYESNANVIQVIDEKYGDGASKYIALAFKAYLDRQ